MELQDLIAEFRRQVSDEAQPYLWSDEEVLAYAIDSQDVFVRRIGGIADVTVAAADVGNPVTRLADMSLEVENPYTLMSPYILRIRSGRLLTAQRDVTFAQESDMVHGVVRDYGVFVGRSFDDERTGNVTYGVLGVRDKYVRWMDVPAVADTCRLHIFRLPFPRIEEQEDDLEIAEQHHFHLTKWMKHLAYSKQDAEARDDGLAEKFRAQAEDYMRTAQQEQQRQRYRPRVVHYGGP